MWSATEVAINGNLVDLGAPHFAYSGEDPLALRRIISYGDGWKALDRIKSVASRVGVQCWVECGSVPAGPLEPLARPERWG